MTRRNEVKEAREKDIFRLMEKTGLPERECRRIFTSFYRLSALEQRLLELDNNEWVVLHQSAWLEAENERAYKWMKRLSKEVEPYGLKIGLRGGFAHFDIVYPDTTGVGTFTTGHYYE